MKTSWDELKEYLPEGWEAKAKELGALTRLREIKSADDLLTLNLLYVGEEASIQATSEMLRLTAGISMNKNAVYKKIKSSWPWLRWMAQELCRKHGMTIEKPAFLGEKKVKLVDASDMAAKGSKHSDYRLHYVFNLFDFQCCGMEITSIKEGEKLPRHEAGKDDIFIADRIYGTITGIEHLLNNNADFVLRFKSKAFNLYDAHGNKLELLSYFRKLDELESTDVQCFYRLPTGELRPLRIVAMKKDAKAREATVRKMKQKVSRKQEKPVQPDTVELNEYIVLATSLDYTNDQILELYRARWQIEQVFFRLKNMFGFGEIPCKNPDTARSWFYGKLLLAALCETILKVECFSPEEEKLVFGLVTKKFME